MASSCCISSLVAVHQQEEGMESAKARKTDRRSIYTRTVIKDSLLSLLTGKDISEITISELCRKAEINRGTFYLHYNNTSEVLDELLNDALQSASDMLVQIGCEATSECGRAYPLCRFIRDNSKYQVLFFSYSLQSQIIDRIMAGSLDIFLSKMRERTGLDDDVLTSLYYFQLNGCLAVTRRSIEAGSSNWAETQCTIDAFLRSGFDSFSK